MQAAMLHTSHHENPAEWARFEDIIDVCGSAVASRLWADGCRNPRYWITVRLEAMKSLVGQERAPLLQRFAGLHLDTKRSHDDMETLYAAGIRRDRAKGMTVQQILAKHRIGDGVYGNPVDLNFVQRVLGIHRIEG